MLTHSYLDCTSGLMTPNIAHQIIHKYYKINGCDCLTQQEQSLVLFSLVCQCFIMKIFPYVDIFLV